MNADKKKFKISFIVFLLVHLCSSVFIQGRSMFGVGKLLSFG
jgi:uncharacterized membrane protein YhhN